MRQGRGGSKRPARIRKSTEFRWRSTLHSLQVNHARAATTAKPLKSRAQPSRSGWKVSFAT